MTPGQPCPRGPAAGAKSQDVYDTVMDLLRTQRVKPTDRVGEILKHEMVQMMSLGIPVSGEQSKRQLTNSLVVSWCFVLLVINILCATYI